MIKSRKSAKKTLPENSSNTNENTLDSKDHNNKITSNSVDPTTPEIEKVIPIVEEDCYPRNIDRKTNGHKN
jgi:hypothetical protein